MHVWLGNENGIAEENFDNIIIEYSQQQRYVTHNLPINETRVLANALNIGVTVSVEVLSYLLTFSGLFEYFDRF